MYADDLAALARDLGEVPANATNNIRAAVEYTARGIKDDWSKTLKGAENIGSFRGVPSTVDYAMGVTGGVLGVLWSAANVRGIEAEIGPNLHRYYGSFAGWFERGAVDGVPATHAGEKAAKANEADFERGLSKAIADAITEAI